MTDNELCRRAESAAEAAYNPYSRFAVGAALLCGDGSVYTGCNIENASFTPTVCAERVAVFKAVSDGKRDFVKIAIAGGMNGRIDGICPPCGVCRQVLAEFCDPEMPVICANRKGEYKLVAMGDLLPDAFLPRDLGK